MKREESSKLFEGVGKNFEVHCSRVNPLLFSPFVSESVLAAYVLIRRSKEPEDCCQYCHCSLHIRMSQEDIYNDVHGEIRGTSDKPAVDPRHNDDPKLENSRSQRSQVLAEIRGKESRDWDCQKIRGRTMAGCFYLSYQFVSRQLTGRGSLTLYK